MSTSSTPEPAGETPSPETYSHGHQPAVLRSHGWRTAENSAGYLLPHLRPGDTVLDVGTGPGTISTGLARRVARVVAVDNAPAAVEAARAAAAGVDNLEVAQGDVYALDFPDDTFDVVHAHQVLQHLSDPVAALVEMRRVCRPGGLVAVRDADYAAMTWFPAHDALDRWLELYHRIAYANGGEPDAGRVLKRWVRRAGFSDLTCSAATWCFASAEDVDWWSDTWAERLTTSDFAASAGRHGLATPAELEALAHGWRSWGADPDAWFAVVHAEVLARA